MSKTDIYENNEQIHQRPAPARKSRRRHKSSNEPRSFDAPKTKRRSKNSGFRRFLHLYRKDRIQKKIWILIGFAFVLLLVVAGLLEFVFQDQWSKEGETEKNPAEKQKVEQLKANSEEISILPTEKVTEPIF